ncbi:propanediol utilization protein [Anoxybacter fermentans]|uniref:Phosphate propanoyltransferase n=2 Tax=Anoxybacter fermentans TaxID=1323375 RepID=A0A3S9SVG2_9FIRM|nr:propanediol utilization protein [Anoxybacter fermentans]
MKEEELIRLITAEVVKELCKRNNSMAIPVALSNRHIHLSQKDLDCLFGPGYTLTKLRDLSQPGQFAAKEKVKLIGPKGILEDVRILGPVRNQTQVEISIGDGYQLGIMPPVRPSGDLADTPGCIVVGPKGVVELKNGVICAQRHIHMSTEDGARFKVRDKEIVKVRCGGLRALVFDQVLVRVSPNFRLEMHLDIEEGNAAGLKNGNFVEILKEG